YPLSTTQYNNVVGALRPRFRSARRPPLFPHLQSTPSRPCPAFAVLRPSPFQSCLRWRRERAVESHTDRTPCETAAASPQRDMVRHLRRATQCPEEDRVMTADLLFPIVGIIFPWREY